jgi:hypothetical protein
MATRTVNINDVLDGHTGLDLVCVDRIYLNAYVPNLQVGGQVERFCSQYLGMPIASPAVIEKIGNRFRRDVDAFAKARGVPVLHLNKPDRTRWDDRKLDHVRPYLEAAELKRRWGVVAVVATQEYQFVFSATKKTGTRGGVFFDWRKAERRVGCYYFYICDREFGPGFIKICTYFPYPAKVWLNGHEWAKRQARRARIGFTELANGFSSSSDPDRLQKICDRLGPADIQAFFHRWISTIPAPLGPAEQAAGYFWELSMRQVEVSRTIVLDHPTRARRFFEALVADNVDIGRPEQVHAVFGRSRRGATTDKPFRTRIFTPGTEVHLDFSYKHSRVKQYLKEGRALRIETVINKPADIAVAARLEHLPELVAKARAVNDRVLLTERAGQGCAIGSALFERIHQPYAREGQRTGAFRFGDTRAMALAGALTAVIHSVDGFTNKSLRGQVSKLLGTDYSTAQMTYDLRRLRLHGLVRRLPHSHTYTLTPQGLRVAIFYTKLADRLLVPLLEANLPPAPPELRQALKVIDRTIEDYVTEARLALAA